MSIQEKSEKMRGVEILGLNSPPSGPLLEPAREGDRKNTVLSWLFSFFFPGVGQLYCGYQTRGWITFFIFWFAVAYTFAFSTSTWQWRMALRYAMALWCFATLDAFFTSREINSGIATLIEGENPRVAAILNLMTKGWGYFYLGRKGVGIATFILLTIADLTIRSLHGHTARLASLAAEFILLGLSAHAYYLGSLPLRRLVMHQAPAPPERLSVAVPMVSAAFVASAYLALVTLGAMLPEYKPVDQRRASTSKDKEGGILYANPKYGVSLHFPPDWEVTNSDKEQFVKGVRPGGGCVVQFMAIPQMPYISMNRHFHELAKTLNAKGQVFDTERDTAVGALAAHEVTFRHQQDETEIDQSFAEVRKGLSIYVVITSSDSDTRSKCEMLSDQIKSSVRLP